MTARVTGPTPAGGVLSGTFPNPAFAEDMATQAELDALSVGGGTAATTTATPAGNLSGTTVEAQLYELDSEKQPLDSDLTAIAALSTTVYGRAFLALVDAAAGRTALGLGTAATTSASAYDVSGAAAAAQAASQPLDSDLTAIAALSTTPYGRGLLALADAAAVKTSLSIAESDVANLTTDLSTLTTNVASNASAIALKAPIASPTFTGTPAAPTATGGTNTTQVATTAFVKAAADAKVADAINDAVTDVAPSQNAVYDALAGKASTAVDAAAGVGSLRTLGTTATQAAPGTSGLTRQAADRIAKRLLFR